MGLDWEAIQNRASVRMGRFAAMSMYPTASTASTRSDDATSTTAPASVWLATNGCRAAVSVWVDSAAANLIGDTMTSAPANISSSPRNPTRR